MNHKHFIPFFLCIFYSLIPLIPSAQQTLEYNTIGDPYDPLPRRYEIARIYIDEANWNWSGTAEFELSEKHYSAGLKKSYIVSYGYGVSPVSFLKDISGEGSNFFQISLG